MRTNRKKIDYKEISRNSIRKDFRSRIQRVDEPVEKDEKRVIFVGENSGYFQLRSYLLGKLMRLRERAEIGWMCEFVYDDDRKAINAAAGWSDNKKVYLLDNCKFN